MTRMLQITQFIAFNSFLTVLINSFLVSAVNRTTINYDDEEIQRVQYDPKVTSTPSSLSSSTFIYYDITQNEDSVNQNDVQSTINPQQSISSGLVPESTTIIYTNETVGLDNGNQTESPIDPFDLSPTIKPERQAPPSISDTREGSIFEDDAQTSNRTTTYESIEPIVEHELANQTEVSVTGSYKFPIDWESSWSTIKNDYLMTDAPSTVTSQSSQIISIVTQPSTEIGTDNLEENFTTQSSDTVADHSTTDHDDYSVITEKFDEISTSTTPSSTTIDGTTINSIPTTTESNQILTTQGQSITLTSGVTISTESSEMVTIGTTEETPQSTASYQYITSTIHSIDWVQSTTITSDDPITIIATESSNSTTTSTDSTVDQQWTTVQTQTESSITTTMWPEILTTTQQPQTEPSIITTKPNPETTHHIETKPPTTTSLPKTTTPERQSTTTIKPEDPTTLSTADPLIEPQVTTTSRPETTTHPVEPQTTIRNNDPTSELNISCDCAERIFDDKPECRFTCNSSILANFHINLTFLGLKIAMVLSNSDYVICIAIGLGCALMISGFALRIIHNRRKRKLIARRNFDILYHEFGTINEKNMKWLSDFNYQSSNL